MEPNSVLSALGGPHVGPMIFAIWAITEVDADPFNRRIYVWPHSKLQAAVQSGV